MDPSPDSTPSAFQIPASAGGGSERGAKGHPGIGWAIIIFMALLAIIGQTILGRVAQADEDDRIALILMEMQARYMVGLAELLGNDEKIYKEARTLEVGSLGQRQRFVVLAAELAGPEEAALVLEQLDAELELELETGGPSRWAAPQLNLQQVLRLLYPMILDEADPIDRTGALTPEQRDLLVGELGWFGQLALTPPSADDEDARAALLSGARRVVIVLVAAVALLIAAGLAGLIGLVVLSILSWNGKLRREFTEGRAHHGIYAETFAVWIVLFFGLQIVAAVFAAVVPPLGLVVTLIAFLCSLVALLWPRVRGVSWDDARRDIGLTRGTSRPWVEPLVGVGGYPLALPLLGVGVALTLVLLLIQTALASPAEPFAPAGGPAHPIVLELASGDWWPRVQVLLLAAVAAPIVEETMFRGVLYRHLRDASAKLGVTLSVLVSGTINALLFASIHPQGWVAIPALMALAFAFVLLREWRDTLIPSIVVHGISNGVVMLLLLTLLSASD